MNINWFSLIFFCVIIPYCVGQLITINLPKDRDSFALNIVCGYLTYFGALEIMTLLCYRVNTSLHFLTAVFVILFGCLAVGSVCINRKRILRIFRKRVDCLKKCKINLIFVCAVLIILAQTYFVSIRQHIDDDDAFYIGMAETAVATDSIMEYDAYTGEKASPPVRYVLSPFPIYHAIMGQLTGVKPVEYAHTLHPIFMIPLGYMLMYLISTVLFEKERICRYYFVTLIALINTFSFYSAYTQGTFFMLRIWQGKAMLCSIVIPSILYFALRVGTEITFSEWFALILTMLSACFVSSMGIILGVISLGCWSLAHLIVTKNWKNTLAMGSCTIPNMILLGIYMMIK